MFPIRIALGSSSDKANKTLGQVLPVIDAFKQKIAKGVKVTPDQIKSIKDMSEVATKLIKQRDENTEELDNLKDSLLSESNSQVIVKDVAFAGTKIGINDAYMTLKSDCQYCRFIKEKGDIKMTGIN